MHYLILSVPLLESGPLLIALSPPTDEETRGQKSLRNCLKPHGKGMNPGLEPDGFYYSYLDLKEILIGDYLSVIITLKEINNN